MVTILIGLDDTDNPTSKGTGHLARQLAKECSRRGMNLLGLTRHQFLLDERIPYTSHNSGACLAVENEDGIENAEFAFDFVAQRSAVGSDPGVCLATPEALTDNILQFAQSATSEVLAQNEAFDLVRNTSIKLRGLGGSCQGVIGALSSVGLRSQGNDGRFIDLPGLREIPEKVGIECFEQLNIEVMFQENSRSLQKNDVFDTLSWIRPRLIGGKPVLPVEWSEQKNAWIPIDRKKSRPLE